MTSTTAVPNAPRSAPGPNPLALAGRLAAARPGLMAVNFALWAAVHATPVLAGLWFKAIFDALAGVGPAGANPWTFLALALSVDVARIGLLGAGVYAWATYWAELVLRMRRNLLTHLLTAPGTHRLPDSPSEAISRFRDDVDDVALYIENWVDFWGLALFGVVALAIMFRIDPLMTGLILVPLGLTLVLTHVLRPTIRAVRRRLREATGRVTDFVGETFQAVASVQAVGREASVVGAFERLGDVRRKAAVRDALLAEVFKNVNDNMVHLATAVILLVGAGAMQRGTFTVGDFALFVSYLPRLTGVVSFLGAMMVQHRRTAVAFERLDGLLDGAGPEVVVGDADLHLRGPMPPFRDPRPDADPLVELRVEGLTVRHGDGALAVADASFTVRRGTFTVVTGRIGSGKSMLVRAVIGLRPIEAGRVLWNGEPVADPASFFVPPRSAYTGQVPRLFSDTLRENVVLGRPDAERGLAAALRTAVLDHDVARMDRGLDTEVGTRGVKLSGGQVQRSAAARMFLRDADLLVFDDLSSALDVETERELWARLFAERADVTCLVVSHRRAALERADQVLVMDAGRIVDRGTFAELLARSPELAGLLGERGSC
jgi:ATP-binding cassette subfamily B protein/ATP-binding cassette subfamily C protein